MTKSNKRENIAKLLREKSLKPTAQRISILGELKKLQTHIEAEELFYQLRKKNFKISLATIYRTLERLSQKGLIKKVNFGDGYMRYEINLPDVHHDHLICEECGKIIEFFNPEIEGLQNNICSEYNFQSTHHTMIIRGICEDCQRKKKVKTRRKVNNNG